MQNFVSIYRIQFETVEVNKIIEYEVNVKVRETIEYFRAYVTSICEELKPTAEQEEKIEQRYQGRRQKVLDDVKKLYNKIKDEIKNNTSLNLKPDDDSTKKVNLIMNEVCNKLTSRERYMLQEELQKIL